MQKKAAILPATGLGDALLMCIGAYHLQKKGYQPYIFHNKFSAFKEWFTKYNILPYEDKEWEEKLKEFDLVILQVDNSPKSKEIKKAREQKNFPPLCCLYPCYVEKKHGKLYEKDIVFTPNIPMADSIKAAMEKLLNEKTNKETGIEIPSHLTWKKNSKQVALCPSSANPIRDWEINRFITLAKKLQKDGYTPIFCVAEQERNDYLEILRKGFTLPILPKVSDFAAIVFESAFVIGNDSFPCHLASCLNIPHIVLSSCRNHLNLWRPAWQKGVCLFPHPLLPNCKFLRLKKLHWKKFISPGRVYKTFQKEIAKFSL